MRCGPRGDAKFAAFKERVISRPPDQLPGPDRDRSVARAPDYTTGTLTCSGHVAGWRHRVARANKERVIARPTGMLPGPDRDRSAARAAEFTTGTCTWSGHVAGTWHIGKTGLAAISVTAGPVFRLKRADRDRSLARGQASTTGTATWRGDVTGSNHVAPRTLPLPRARVYPGGRGLRGQRHA